MLRSNAARSEVYNLNFRKSRVIEEGPKLDDSTVLYIEVGDTKDKNENFRWH